MTIQDKASHALRRWWLVRWWHWYGIYRRFYWPLDAARKAYRLARDS